jgi:hypothetical protein
MSNIDCLLTQGFSVGCRDNTGGIKKVYLGNWENLTYTEDAEGIITNITDASGNFALYEYMLQKNISSLTENISMEPANETVTYSPEVMIVLNKLDTAKRNELALIAKSLTIAIVEDLNGAFWIVGKGRGLDLSSAIRQTGAASSDRNGTEFTLIGTEAEPFQQIVFGAFNSFID